MTALHEKAITIVREYPADTALGRLIRRHVLEGFVRLFKGDVGFNERKFIRRCEGI